MMRILLFLLAQYLFWGTCGLWSSNWFGNKRPVEVVHEEPTPDTLTLMFIGDVMSHMPQVDAARLPDGTYDYAPCYRFLAPYIASADICIANMEVPLAGSPYTGYPQFSCPDNMMSQLFDAGVDVFLTANNHTCDKGAKGIRRTIHVMDSLGIAWVLSRVDVHDITKDVSVQAAALLRTHNLHGHKYAIDAAFAAIARTVTAPCTVLTSDPEDLTLLCGPAVEVIKV
jgi:hypothetical protein